MGWIQNLVAKIAAKKIEKKLNLTEGPVETKKWWTSKTMWAGVVTALLGLYELAKPLAEQFGHPLPQIPGVVFTFLGALGVYGRATATKTIG